MKKTGEGNGNPLQYSCLENPVDRGAWWAAVHSVTYRWTRLKQFSMHACIGEGNGNPLQYSCLDNPMDRGACLGCRLWCSTESDMTEQLSLSPLFLSSSNCCFLTCIQISQKADQVVWYSHKNFLVCCDPHSQRLWPSQ